MTALEHINDMVAMHAALLADPAQQYVPRLNDAYDQEESYRFWRGGRDVA